MKLFKTISLSIACLLLLATGVLAQDVQQPRVACVASDCSTLFVSNTAGTTLNGGEAVAVTAVASTAVAAAQTDCSSPGYATCNFLYVTSAGGVPAVTQVVATAGAAGNSLLALVQTDGTAITRISFPNQSATVDLQVLGPLGTFSVSPTPAAAGGSDLGTAALPWGSVFIGNAATDNFEVTGVATAARVFTLMDTASDTFVMEDAIQVLTNKSLTSPALTTATIVTSLDPSAAGAATIGTNALPFSSVFIGATTINAFEFTGTSTGASAITIPDTAGADTLVMLDLAQVLTQKTLTSPVLNTATVGTSIASAVAGTSDVGTLLLPFGSVFIGAAATNNIELTGTGTGSEVLTLPDTTDTLVAVDFAQVLTNKTLTSPAITTDLHSTVAATSTVGTAALPFASAILGTVATDVFTITPAALAAAVAVTMPDPGGAATFAYTNSTNAQVLTNNTYVSSADAAVADAGAIRLGSAEVINWRNNADGANIGLTTDATDLLVWDGDQPVDGYYVVPPSACTMTLTVGVFAANPATSGALSAPSMVRTAVGNTVQQVTTTAAANTTVVTCDMTPPSRLLAGAGIEIFQVKYTFGYQTTALTSIGAWAPNSVTYPAVAGNPNTTAVAAIGGALTVTAGDDHVTPGGVTAAGELYNELVEFGTPYAVEVDHVRLMWENSFVQTAASASVVQVGPTFVYYTTARF